MWELGHDRVLHLVISIRLHYLLRLGRVKVRECLINYGVSVGVDRTGWSLVLVLGVGVVGLSVGVK